MVFQQGGFSPQWSHMGSSMSFKWHRMDFLPHPETERDDSLYIEQSHQINSANSVDISLTQILHMHACMHACTHTTYTYTTHTHTYTTLHYAPTHPHTDTLTHTTHTHIYIHTYTPTHTNKQNYILSLIKQAKSGGCMLHTDFRLCVMSNQGLTSLHFK